VSRLQSVPDSPPRAVLYLRQSHAQTARVQITWSMPPKPRSIEERIWDKFTRRGPDDCWPWTGAKTSAGYGHIGRPGYGTGSELGHRALYEILVGPIPEGMVLDHTCHSSDPECPGNAGCPHRACVNPAHLEPVEFGDNCMRGRGVAPRNAAKTHCHNGHEYTAKNTRLDKHGARVCKACAAARLARWKARHPDYISPVRRR